MSMRTIIVGCVALIALVFAAACASTSAPEATLEDAGTPVAKAPWPPAGSFPAIAPTQADKLVVVRAKADLTTDNPYAEYWNSVPSYRVPVIPQLITMPQLLPEQKAVDQIDVQAVTDGKTIAWRLTWADATADGNVDTARFTDGVAMQFPLAPGAAPMMGHRETGKVQIIHWKALWQKDLDVGFQDVQDLHPNYWSDLYWFAEGQFPYPVPSAFKDPRSMQWFIANQAGNPMAVFSRTQPAEELIAEGFGTLTHQKDSVSRAKGVWANGTWSVVFSRPLASTDPLDFQFQLGGAGQVSFAVWEGTHENVGGRKHWTNWVPFEVQP